MPGIPEPNREPYQDPSESPPVTRPDLKALEGGGETTEPRTGHLQSVPDEKRAGPSQLNQAEESAGKANEQPVRHENTLGLGYVSDDQPETNSPKNKRRFRITRRRAVVGGGVVGAIVGIMFFLSSITGPFQFMQFAQLVQQFHIAGHENAGDSRTSGLTRFARSGLDARETRVGHIGSRMAPKIEARFKTAGFKPVFEGPAKFLTNYEVDKNAAHGRWKNLSDDDFVKEIKKEYGKDLTRGSDGKWKISAAKGWFGGEGKFNRKVLVETGSWKITSPIQSRVWGRWAGTKWHPMRKIDAKINETFAKFAKKLKAKRATRIAEGSYGAVGTAERQPKKENETKEEKEAREAADKAASDAERETGKIGEESEAVTEDEDGAKTQRFANSLKARLAMKAGLGAAAATAVICLLYTLNDKFEVLKQSRIILPLMRVAGEAISLGNQVMNGGDVDLDQLRVYNDFFNDPKTGSWTNSRTMQAESGQPQTGPPVDEKLSKINDKSPLAGISKIPGIGKLCSTAGQIIAGVVSVVIGFFTGGVSTIISAAVSFIIGGIAADFVINFFASLMAGTTVNPYARGVAFGDQANYGGRLMGNGIGLSRGGAEISPQQSQEIKQYVTNDVNNKFASKNIAYRLFSPYDPKSAFAKLIASQSTSLSGNFAKMSRYFFNFGNMFASFPKQFAASVHAATPEPYDYGFPEYSYSINELENSKFENPYKNAKRAAELLSDNTYGPFAIVKAKECFGVIIEQTTIGGEGPLWSAKGSDNPNDMPNPYDVTTGKYKDLKCDLQDDRWLTIRFFVFDSVMMDSLYCYEEDDAQSCANVGFGSATPSGGSGGTTESSPPVEPPGPPVCAPGDKKPICAE